MHLLICGTVGIVCSIVRLSTIQTEMRNQSGFERDRLRTWDWRYVAIVGVIKRFASLLLVLLQYRLLDDSFFPANIIIM